jgi:hypothetical protein
VWPPSRPGGKIRTMPCTSGNQQHGPAAHPHRCPSARFGHGLRTRTPAIQDGRPGITEYRPAAPIRAISVKRAYGPGPVTTRGRRAGLIILLDPSSQLPGLLAARPGSGWSARSRAAARTNELDAGKRRKIIGGGEGLGCGWACQGSCACSRCVAGGVVSQAPIRRRASVRAAAMTMCPGPGCSVR